MLLLSIKPFKDFTIFERVTGGQELFRVPDHLEILTNKKCDFYTTLDANHFLGLAFGLPNKFISLDL